MNAPVSPRRDLYPSFEPFRTDWLQVSPLHRVYYEESGAIDGLPVVALHGGPGGGSSPEMRRFFDPRRYRIILFDQRGCGRSTPHGEIQENTTWDLIADMEALRERLRINRWVVFGGSWGSTLALAYAVKHPERVTALILRGVFLLTEAEISWFYQSGASHIFPDAFERYISPIPPGERGDLLSAFHKRIFGQDPAVRAAAMAAWARWEGETISINGPGGLPQRFNDDRFIEAFARLEAHYFFNRGFFPNDGWLLDQISRIRRIPCRAVHGRYDVCTPISSAWALKKAWPEVQLDVVPDAGHSSLEPGIVDALVRATDHFAAALRR
jgi:proline iminopeptidase